MFGDAEHRGFSVPQWQNETLDRQTLHDRLRLGAGKARDCAHGTRTRGPLAADEGKDFGLGIVQVDTEACLERICSSDRSSSLRSVS